MFRFRGKLLRAAFERRQVRLGVILGVQHRRDEGCTAGVQRAQADLVRDVGRVSEGERPFLREEREA